jgi:hypothetical protein
MPPKATGDVQADTRTKAMREALAETQRLQNLAYEGVRSVFDFVGWEPGFLGHTPYVLSLDCADAVQNQAHVH